jgi:hypothetical protein
MKMQVRLNLYERGIVDSLVEDFGYTASQARELVVQYIEVVRKLGGYDSCELHAERLIQAQKIGMSPNAWLDRIGLIERENYRDKGIPVHTKGTEFAVVR